MTALKKSPDKQANKCWVIVRFERAGHALSGILSLQEIEVHLQVYFAYFDTYGDCKWSNHTFARFSRDERL